MKITENLIRVDIYKDDDIIGDLNSRFIKINILKFHMTKEEMNNHPLYPALVPALEYGSGILIWNNFRGAIIRNETESIFDT